MARSPFPANALITFEVTTAGTLTVDPATGNTIVEKTPVVLEAYLKRSRGPNPVVEPGVDRSSETLEGRLVEPISLPNSISFGAVGTAVINGQSGTIRLRRGVQSAFGVNLVIGDKIYCDWEPGTVRTDNDG